MFNHRYRVIFPGILALFSFFNILLLDGDRIYQVELPVDATFVLIFSISYAVWFSNSWIEKFLVIRLKKIHPLLVQFISSLIAVGLISLIAVIITGSVYGGPFAYSTQNFLLTSAFGYRINLFLNTLNAVFFFAKKLKEKELEAEKLKTLNANAKLETINNQLNPHFFFNNLSALSNLMHQDIELADLYLQKLSNIYRYILKNSSNELIPFRQEYNFLNDYIDLLGIRFQSALTFKKEIDDTYSDYSLPPAVLQLLVENVVKHNFFTMSQPMEVLIRVENAKCTIRNKKQEKLDKGFSSGVGLQNIMERYKFLGREIEVIDEPEFFQVTLSLIHSHESSNS
ncbi:sensor histidine kinase [Cecembia calidifontis]|jgi:sensor histidine kinase YesM|uniref:Histidine kinase n=1 Tax=Cecembia calidifontis TaxID=1187080 RepID=A0A4Q7P9V7_9BACT|nr:histidine kinase [Cecembia calidifontis]RZS97026.1 histidine kinase [Cecembia calidifontis]